MNHPSEHAAAAGASPRLGQRVSPYCVHLSSKKLMIADAPPMTTRDVLDASQHCWCARTMQVLGPDRMQCHPEDCTKGRDCFESPLADLL